MDRRRLENVLAPVAIVAVIAVVLALVLLRPGPDERATDAGADGADGGAPGATSDPSTGPTPTPSATPTGPASRPPRERRGGGERALPRLRPLASRLPEIACTEAPPRTVTVDVVTYNIKAGRDSPRGLGSIAAELASWDPDVVLMQEVDRFRSRTGRVDQPASLAAALGPSWSWTFGANVSERPGAASGTAILSRFPILADLNTALPNERGGQPRGVLSARLRIGGTEVTVHNTHLEPRRPYAPLRVRQMSAVIRAVDADEGPAILGGDFNSGPGTDPLRVATGGRLADSWSLVGRGAGNTVPAGNAQARIDFLLGSAEFVPVASQVLVGTSDHRAVRTTYEIETGGDACIPPGSVS
ncbi:hypothetical protein GCM10009737_28880 [Nocardioides lentus]|uniref:Endonuclease/exonuclease/phosphatase domain-containing protein n=1 Tax=Nocardioides lentus TaxID=338077 RepID=A0ABP5AY04_9ACTN